MQIGHLIQEFEPKDIFQMDETPTYIDMLSNRSIDTIDFCGNRSISICIFLEVNFWWQHEILYGISLDLFMWPMDDDDELFLS